MRNLTWFFAIYIVDDLKGKLFGIVKRKFVHKRGLKAVKNENTFDSKNDERVDLRKKRVRMARIASIIIFVIVILIGVFIIKIMPSEIDAAAVVKAEYPNIEPYPSNELLPGFDEKYDKWVESRREIRPESGYGDGLESYFEKTVGEFLRGTNGENRVFSPLSLYMALSMAAETADGDSRAQILSLIGREDIVDLRKQANAVWRGSYANDGATTSIMANSVWLDNELEYNKATVDSIAKNYYASVFRGEMASEELNEAMRSWLNEQTGGLLKDQIKNVGVKDPSTIMALFSTVYYRAKWATEFNPKSTVTDVFHTPNGNVDAEYMCRTLEGSYYWSENFAAISIGLENSGEMWLVLPDEDVTMDELLADKNLYKLVFSSKGYIPLEEWEDQKYIKINLRMPKFDVSSDYSLTDGLKNLGVTDIFNREKADLTPLVTDSELTPYYSSAKQAARVTVDEEGVYAAAFTEMMVCGAAMPPEEEVDFTLDRPFLFSLYHNSGLSLFTGVVNEP